MSKELVKLKSSRNNNKVIKSNDDVSDILNFIATSDSRLKEIQNDIGIIKKTLYKMMKHKFLFFIMIVLITMFSVYTGEKAWTSLLEIIPEIFNYMS